MEPNLIQEYLASANSAALGLNLEALLDSTFGSKVGHVKKNLFSVLDSIKREPSLEEEYHPQATFIINLVVSSFDSSALTLAQASRDQAGLEDSYQILFRHQQIVQGLVSRVYDTYCLCPQIPACQEIFNRFLDTIYFKIEEYLSQASLYQEEIERLIHLARRVVRENCEHNLFLDQPKIDQYLQTLKEETTPPNLIMPTKSIPFYDPLKEPQDEAEIKRLAAELVETIQDLEHAEEISATKIESIKGSYLGEMERYESALTALQRENQQLQRASQDLEAELKDAFRKYQKDLGSERELVEQLKAQLKVARDPERLALVIARKNPDGTIKDFHPSALYSCLDSGRKPSEQDIWVYSRTRDSPLPLVETFGQKRKFPADQIVWFEDPYFIVGVYQVDERKLGKEPKRKK